MRRLGNPLSFTPAPVTIVTSLIYVVLLIALLVIHHTVPQARAIEGVSVEEAWHDLQFLSSAFHPYNSRRNDEVRAWLLQRIDDLAAHGKRSHADDLVENPGSALQPSFGLKTESQPLVVFNDLSSNLSSSINASALRPAISTYFESTSIIVYIRGSEDDPTEWWTSDAKPSGEGGVLVNAHYDSVSTGNGATDDGVGVVTILQLIKYFSRAEHQPKKGVVALFNNGEEDFLNGARVFFQHPISKFPRTFLNLEGAGAGGKATLFRSTNSDVTKSYQRVQFPMGNVISADGFKRGLIRSETDYSIFYPQGMRGLDVAFYAPRSRYHTNQDDTRHTSKASVYHMLSASLETMKGLTAADESQRGEGMAGVWFDLFGRVFAVFTLKTLYALSVTLLVVAPVILAAIGAALYRSDRQYILSGSTKAEGLEDGEPVSIKGRRGVFRWPIAFILAIVAVILLGLLVSKVNPYILYSSPYAVWSMYLSAFVSIAWASVTTADYFRPTAFQRLYTILWLSLIAWIILIFATISERKIELGGAYLLFFYHASIFIATTITLLELFGLPRKRAYASELANPPASEARAPLPETGSIASAQLIGPSAEEGSSHAPADHEDDEGNESDTNERTSLLQGTRTGPKSFKHYHSPSSRERAHPTSKPKHPRRRVYHHEQAWSHSLPTYLWLLEFLITSVVPIVLIGQTALLFTTAVSQTLADGASPGLPYLSIGVLAILLLAPLGPFLHRFTYHIPLFLFLVCIGTILYNLFAFPFSAENRLKINFVQRINLDDTSSSPTSTNTVTLSGVSRGHYLRDIVASLPSTGDQSVSCGPSRLPGLQSCNYTGLLPSITPTPATSSAPAPYPLTNATKPSSPFSNLFNLTITPHPSHANTALFHLATTPQTRNCVLKFDQPVTSYTIKDSNSLSDRFPAVPPGGTSELRLWSRSWGNGWRGELTWAAPSSSSSTSVSIPDLSSAQSSSFDPTQRHHHQKDKNRNQNQRPQLQKSELRPRHGSADAEPRTKPKDRPTPDLLRKSGTVTCMYADTHPAGTIPALEEIWQFAPTWAAVTKAGDGLVEVGRGWEV